MGGSHPSESNGVDCIQCGRRLPPCKDWDDFTKEWVDRIVRNDYCYVYNGGQYYRIVGHHMAYYCPEDWWRPKMDYLAEQERKRREERERQRREREEREREAERQRELARQAELERIRQERQRQEEERQRQEEARREAERLEALRQQREREREAQDAREEQEQIIGGFGGAGGAGQDREEERTATYNPFVSFELARSEFNSAQKGGFDANLMTGLLGEMDETEEVDVISREMVNEAQASIDELIAETDEQEYSGLWLKGIQCMMLAYYMQSNVLSQNEQELLLDFLATLQLDISDEECLSLSDAFTDMVTTNPAEFSEYFRVNPDLPFTARLSSLLLQTGKHYKKNNTWMKQCLQTLVVALTTDEALQKQFTEASCKNWTGYNWFQLFEKCQEASISEPLQKQAIHKIQTYCVSPSTVLGILDSQPQNFLSAVEQAVEDLGNQLLVEIFAEMRETGFVEETFLNHVETLATKVWNKLGEVNIELDHSKEFQKNLATTKSVFQKLANSRLYVSDDEIASAIFTLMCACLEVAPFYPRRTQIVSLIILILSSQQGQNYLQEVMTGEGKSLIVVLFGTVLGVQGKHVDIVTSSPILAVRDVEEWAGFYNLFGLTVAHNTDIERPADADPKDYKQAAYKCDVVYGTVGTFAADILRDEFKQEDIRPNRRFDAVIVDEVDMLMLDEGVQFTYLSHDAAILHHIEPVIAATWGLAGTLRVAKTADGEIMYVGAPKVVTDAIFESLDPALSLVEDPSQIIATALDIGSITQAQYDGLLSDDQEIKKETASQLSVDTALQLISGLEEYENMPEFEAFTVNSLGTLEPLTLVTSRINAEKLLLLEGGQACIVNTKSEIIDRATEILKAKLVYESENGREEGIWVPSFLREYVQHQLPNYVDSALRALHMKEDREYSITKNRIIPIDYDNSGVMELNKKWGGGLQQMIELKHNLSISPVSLVTNFMSNVEFFSRYLRSGGIYGMSGTLGLDNHSNTTMILEELYNTKVCYIPTFKFRKLYEKPAIIVQNNEMWFHQIVQTIVEETTEEASWKKGRAVLVLCEDIKTAEDLKAYILDVQKWDPEKVFLYAHSTSNQLATIKQKKKLGPRELVIATNLAGRGTNIKVTDEVNESGGLLCLVTFLARNRRVELQAFGRTARGGKPGNCRAILNYSAMPAQYEGLGIEDIRTMRAAEEALRLNRLINNDVKEVQLREELFKDYCVYLKDINTRLLARDDIRVVIDCLNENWGQWLDMKNSDIEAQERDSLKADLTTRKAQWFPWWTVPSSTSSSIYPPVANFYHYVKLGNRLMFSENDSEVRRAITYFSQSITLQGDSAVIAYYNRAYARIVVEESNYKANAKSDITEAKKRLDVYIAEVSKIQQFSGLVRQVRHFEERKTDDFEDEIIPLKDFDTQMETRLEFFKFLKDEMQKAIQKIDSIDGDIIAKASGIFSLIPDADYSTNLEMTRMWSLGLELVYSIEKKPRFCWEGLVVFLLGVAQIVGGVLLTVFTVGAAAQFGMGLIGEGISDCIAGIEGMITGEFSWAEWAIEKAVGLALSLISGGISRLASTGLKAIKTGYKIAKVGRQLKAIPKIIKNTAGSAMRKNLKTAAKYVAKEAVIQGISYSQYHLMRLLIEEVSKQIGNKMGENCLESTRQRLKSGYMNNLINERYIKDLGTYYANQTEVSAAMKKRAKWFFTNAGENAVGELVRNDEIKDRITMALGSLTQQIGEESKKLGKYTNILSFALAMGIITETVTRLGILVTSFPDRIEEVSRQFYEDEELTVPSSHSGAQYSYTCANNLKDELAEHVSEIFGQSVTTLLQGQLNVLLTGNEVNRKMSKLSRGVIGKYVLKTDRTMQDMRAMENANYIRSVGADMSGSGKISDSKVAKDYAESIKNSDKAGSLLELRIAAENYGQKVTIYQEKNGKLVKDCSVDPEVKRNDSEIELLYTPDPRPDQPGHYDVIVGSQRKRVQSEYSNCLYHAFAYGRNSNLSPQDLVTEARRVRKNVADSIEEMPQAFSEHIRRRKEMDNLRRGNRFVMLGSKGKNPDTKILDNFYHQRIVNDTIFTMYRQDNGVICKAKFIYDQNLTTVNNVVQEYSARVNSFKVEMTGLNMNKAKGKRCWDTKFVVGQVERAKGKAGSDSEVSFHLIPSHSGANAGDQYANAVPTSPDYNRLEMAIWTPTLKNHLKAGGDFKMTAIGTAGPVNAQYQGPRNFKANELTLLAKRYKKFVGIEPRAYQMKSLRYEIEMPGGTTTADLASIVNANTNARLTVTSVDNTGTTTPSKIVITMGPDYELFTPKPQKISKMVAVGSGELFINELAPAYATQKQPNLTVDVKPRYWVTPGMGGLTATDQAQFDNDFNAFAV